MVGHPKLANMSIKPYHQSVLCSANFMRQPNTSYNCNDIYKSIYIHSWCWSTFNLVHIILISFIVFCPFSLCKGAKTWEMANLSSIISKRTGQLISFKHQKCITQIISRKVWHHSIILGSVYPCQEFSLSIYPNQYFNSSKIYESMDCICPLPASGYQ